MTTWKDRVFALRVARRESQAMFGGVLGVTRRTITRWEHGDTEPGKMHQEIIKSLERHDEQMLKRIRTEAARD